MFIVYVVIAALLLAWGNNIGAYAIEIEGTQKMILSIMQIALIAIALVVFSIGIG